MEAHLTRYHIFMADKYDFIDYKKGTKRQVKMTKSRGWSAGDDHCSVKIDSYFILDGVNIFDILAEKGLRLKLDMSAVFQPVIHVLDKGDNEVATVRMLQKSKRYPDTMNIGNQQCVTTIETAIEDTELILLLGIITVRTDPSLKRMA